MTVLKQKEMIKSSLISGYYVFAPKDNSVIQEAFNIIVTQYLALISSGTVISLFWFTEHFSIYLYLIVFIQLVAQAFGIAERFHISIRYADGFRNLPGRTFEA
jgi:hypothetical protein